MKTLIDRTSSKLKHILHGFFLSIATTIAEPATILPVIVSYFNASPLVIGFFSSLLKGGAILVQIIAAFWAQSYPRMMPYLYYVFAARFLSWMGIGVSIVLFGQTNPTVTLILMGMCLFIFSFAAGFGTVYFNEILAKVFTHKVRGQTTAIRQFVSGLGAISSGAAAGIILSTYEPPLSFGYLFMASALIMLLGIVSFSLIEEPIKLAVRTKEVKFRHYLKNTFEMLSTSKGLQVQILTYLLSYSYLFALPFVILDAQTQIGLTGTRIGMFVSLQMMGAMGSNILWGYLSGKGNNKAIVIIAFIASIMTMVLAFYGGAVWIYGTLFFLTGAATDGFKLAFGNLILIIAPEEKRPIYIALQSNLTSIGLFFSIPGALILSYFGYEVLYAFTAVVMSLGLSVALLRLQRA